MSGSGGIAYELAPVLDSCRLCGGLSNDLADVFSEETICYAEKIRKYLYLAATPDDEYSKKICWMCCQHLDNFHKFCEKINQTQRQLLGEKYDQIALKQNCEPVAVTAEEVLLPQLPAEPETRPVAVVEELFDYQSSVKEEETPRRVTRQRAKRVQAVEVEHDPFSGDDSDDEFQPVSRPKRAKKQQPAPPQDDDHPPLVEGESGDELPATADGELDDLVSNQAAFKFPDRLLEDGHLQIKGRALMQVVCNFFTLECDRCPDRPCFQHLLKLFAHYKERHGERGYVTCCGAKLSRYPAIVMHCARHLQPDAFQCEICQYQVTRPRFLDLHRQTHLPAEQKPLVCPQCPRRFCWKGALNVHLASHLPPADRKLYRCPSCPRTYETPGGLSTHKRLAHKPGFVRPKIACHACQKQFATPTGFKEHFRTIHAERRELDQLQCHVCSKWLANKRCLKSHLLLHSETDHVCGLCDYATKKPLLLKRHMKTQHSEARPFACDDCPKSFKLKRLLQVHAETAHARTARSFSCPFCGRTFASSTNFYTHRKNMHPAELAELKEQQEREKRLKRIELGVEEPAMVGEAQGEEVTLVYDMTSSTLFQLSPNSGRELSYGEGEETEIIM